MTVHHNAASALPVKQNARISARNRGSKENGTAEAYRHDEAHHTIHGLWVQTKIKLAGWRGSLVALGAADRDDLVFEELTQHRGPMPGTLPCAVPAAARGKHGSCRAPLG